MHRKTLIISLTILLLCPIAKGQQTEDYPLPTVPDSITELEPRADYMVYHYWEAYNFKDTTLLEIPEYAEQALSNFIALLSYASPLGKQQAIDKWIALAATNDKSYSFFTKEAERYLYHPDSPIKNEDLFLQVLNSILALPIEGDEMESLHAQYLRQLISRNQPGNPAENFAFELPDGQRDSLYTFVPDKPLLLLFFDPECESCQHTITQLHNNTTITQALDNNQLALLTIIPDNAPDINANALYDLKTLPTLYLLSPSRDVILKDTTPDALADYLQKHILTTP
ncbi:MAG: DUF5106 domain-containing protein [Bacteroidaceae bacterium]|nr:DUF5106 domain-containing protein [Bacteroidaceae bacterium]